MNHETFGRDLEYGEDGSDKYGAYGFDKLCGSKVILSSQWTGGNFMLLLSSQTCIQTNAANV